ncbi:MAG: IS1634 family transposase [Methanoregula sp.]|nr:IS1634 family transposase [Methanoregula sp.]
MTIRRVKKGNSIYLYEYESYREEGKVKSKFVRYLGVEGDEFKVPKPKIPRVKILFPQRSKRYGDVALLWQIAERANFVSIIDRITIGRTIPNGISPGRLLTAWAINRIINPDSASQLENWILTTDLPRLMGVKEDAFSKDRFLSALDMICSYDPESDRLIDFTNHIDDALYQHWRAHVSLPDPKGETLAYDLTAVLLYGDTCPLVEKGYNSKHSRQHQINLTMLISTKDNYPLAHCIFPGNFSSLSTVQSLFVRINEMGLQPGTIIWDRGNTTKDTILTTERFKWKIITGIPKQSNEVKDILASIAVPMHMDNMISFQKNGELYAIQTVVPLFKADRKVTVCLNPDTANKDIRERNFALRSIREELKALESSCPVDSAHSIQMKVKKIINGWTRFITYTVNKEKSGFYLIWSFNEECIKKAAQIDGKFLLYATESSLSAEEVIHLYFGKDAIEKVFRFLKTNEKLEPVRHYLEQRVRAYFFVCDLAYRLITALNWFIRTMKVDNQHEIIQSTELLRLLSRVERCDLGMLTSNEVGYLNLLKKTSEQIERMGFDIFDDMTLCST